MVAGLGAVALDRQRELGTTYSPRQIKFYLRHYDKLEWLSRHHDPDEPKVHVVNPFPWAGFERACGIRADLDRAIIALGSLRGDGFYALVVQKYYVQHEPLDHIATILRTDTDTVKDAKNAAIDWMANFLNDG